MVEKRYNDFLTLDEMLKSSDLTRATLPNRDALGIRRRIQGPQFEENRKTILGEYLEHLSSQVESLASNRWLNYFLCAEKGSFLSDVPLCQRVSSPEGSPERSSKNVASDASHSQVAGPSVFVIVKPNPTTSYERLPKGSHQKTLRKVRKDLVDLLESGCGCNLKVDTISFPEESALHNHTVFSVSATFGTLCELAENQELPKALVADEVIIGGRVHLKWRNFELRHSASFIGIEDPVSFFTPHEVLHLIYLALSTCKAPGCDHPALLAAKAADEVDCVLALHDHEDLERKSAKWKSAFSVYEEPPASDLVSYFGPGDTVYFAFMQQYSRWLVLPAIFCSVCALIYQTTAPKGAHFGTSWFSTIVTMLITVWSTLFCAQASHMLKILMHGLGHDSRRRQRNTFDFISADVYFDFQGLLVTKDGVQLNRNKEALRKKENGQAHLLTYAFMVVSMGTLFILTGVIIGMLLWIGDFVALYTSNVILVNLPTVLYIGIVGIFEIFYRWLAKKLTQLEQHQMYCEYLKSLTFKTAAFTIMNTLGWFMYVAFWQRDMAYLRAQLLIFFTVKQVIGNFTETGLPVLQNWWHRRQAEARTVDSKLTRPSTPKSDSAKLRSAIEEQWQQELVDLGDDFAEVATLYAAAVWFAPVFPLGMLLALVHAVTETVSDRYKMCYVARRSLPDPYFAVQMETWLHVLSAIGVIGAPVSLGLTYIAHGGAWDFQALVLAEHAILFVKLYLMLSIPREPEWLNHHLSH